MIFREAEDSSNLLIQKRSLYLFTSILPEYISFGSINIFDPSGFISEYTLYWEKYGEILK